jgi:2'-5' RNA ligase
MRCFAAVWPGSEAAAALARLARPPLPGLRWSTPDQWHVTLRFFGELAPAEVDAAAAALGALAARQDQPVVAEAGPATRFLGTGLIIWPVEGLAPLAREAGRATGHLGEPPPDRPFLGHLTLARAGRGAAWRDRTDLLAPLASSWTVTSLSLVRSDLGPAGARYHPVAEYPFGL